MVLTFTPSVTELNIHVTIINDNPVGMDENFFGDLTTSAGGVTTDPAEANISILGRGCKLLKSNNFFVIE